MKKFNRWKKKRAKQADKLSQYLLDAISGKNAESVEGEAKQLKQLMKTLGLNDQSIDFNKIMQNPQQAQAFKEEMVLLIMAKDADVGAMSQVDGMIEKIDQD